LQTREGIGAQGDAADSRESLAEIAFEQGRLEEAERMAREAGEARRAWATSKWLFRLCRRELYCARAKWRKLPKKSRPLEFFLREARNKPRGLSLNLQRRVCWLPEARPQNAAFDTLLRDASKKGYVGYELEARLASGKTDMVSGQIARGRPQLRKLAEEAEAKGFGLIARKARYATK
jgi:hypothetical protein